MAIANKIIDFIFICGAPGSGIPFRGGKELRLVLPPAESAGSEGPYETQGRILGTLP
jgi:hypothetical protein